jgi:hypothetical protein
MLHNLAIGQCRAGERSTIDANGEGKLMIHGLFGVRVKHKVFVSYHQSW